MATVLVPLPNTVRLLRAGVSGDDTDFWGPAEFRGPGVHHNFDDSDSGYDVDENKSKPFGLGGYKGRIIFLGDGTEVLTDSDDAEMFDNAEEDKDLASQVSKSSSSEEDSGSLPRAPSPPAKGQTNEATPTKSEQSTTKDTPAEAKTESTTKDEPKKDEASKPEAGTQSKA